MPVSSTAFVNALAHQPDARRRGRDILTRKRDAPVSGRDDERDQQQRL